MEKDELISLIAHAIASGTHAEAIAAIEKYDEDRFIELELVLTDQTANPLK